MNSRLGHLDGLRGLAACLVLYQHLAEYMARQAPNVPWVQAHLAFLFEYVNFGKVGVVAFFAISGFIVPSSFRAESAQPRLQFVLSRFFRLYPAFWASIACALLVLPFLGSTSINSIRVLGNLTMLPSLFGQIAVLDVYWTLAVEWVFYVLCIAVFSLGGLQRWEALCLVFSTMLLLAFVGAVGRANGIDGLPVSLPLYLAAMWFGACMRLAVLNGDYAARNAAWGMGVVLLVAIPLIWNTAFDDNSHKESVLSAICGFIGGMALFLWCVLGRVFKSHLLVWLGGISYSLYLFHPLALDLASHAAGQIAAATASLWTLIILTTLLSLGAAITVRRLVEIPAIALGRRCAQRLGNCPPRNVHEGAERL